MGPRETALPAGGPAKLAQTAPRSYPLVRRERLLLPAALIWCLLAVDAVLWAPGFGAGVTAAVFGWYALLLAARGEALFRTGESRCLLVACLALACVFSLRSSELLLAWDFLALLVLVPLHTCVLADRPLLPWWRPAMVPERAGLFLGGAFGALGAVPAALTPVRGRKRRVGAAAMGVVLAAALLALLVHVLAAGDALFAAVTAALRDAFSALFDTDAPAIQELCWALVLTPFVFSLLYRLRHPAPVRPRSAAKAPAIDPVTVLILLAAMDGLYLLFLLVQSAGLFGGEQYLAQRGLSYAQWARSGFFEMTGVTAVNLLVLLSAAGLTRRGGRGWLLVRALSALLCLESLVLLSSALWRMCLYVSAYGLSYKRALTYWGMAMMALFLLLALRKVWRPDTSFCRAAFPLALAGWLVLNCADLERLVARDQVDRYLSGQSSHISIEYLIRLHSYSVLPELERLAGQTVLSDESGYVQVDSVLAHQRARARAACADWRSWDLSACLAAGAERAPASPAG